ncbi:hypothetical protein K488DRAFT_69568 [Vararia minispora EC-137]|uniref:Uncharacterized protein n=1 Tax=Vararia minispora EC-137 TaxID=1314806 RepID=A0ACB8QPV4_9AGAM|nr:hypothetical protein K488DRAFT_69568 [Vararia minispora EC-137]
MDPFRSFIHDPPNPLIYASFVPIGPHTEGLARLDLVRPHSVYSIGRDKANFLLPVQNSANLTTSRRHAEIHFGRDRHEGVIEIIDKSTNGTMVNGKRIEPDQYYRLKLFDMVVFGPPEILRPDEFYPGLGLKNRSHRHFRYQFFDFAADSPWTRRVPGLTKEQLVFRDRTKQFNERLREYAPKSPLQVQRASMLSQREDTPELVVPPALTVEECARIQPHVELIEDRIAGKSVHDAETIWRDKVHVSNLKLARSTPPSELHMWSFAYGLPIGLHPSYSRYAEEHRPQRGIPDTAADFHEQKNWRMIAAHVQRRIAADATQAGKRKRGPEHYKRWAFKFADDGLRARMSDISDGDPDISDDDWEDDDHDYPAPSPKRPRASLSLALKTHHDSPSVPPPVGPPSPSLALPHAANKRKRQAAVDENEDDYEKDDDDDGDVDDGQSCPSDPSSSRIPDAPVVAGRRPVKRARVAQDLPPARVSSRLQARLAASSPSSAPLQPVRPISTRLRAAEGRSTLDLDSDTAIYGLPAFDTSLISQPTTMISLNPTRTLSDTPLLLASIFKWPRNLIAHTLDTQLFAWDTWSASASDICSTVLSRLELTSSDRISETLLFEPKYLCCAAVFCRELVVTPIDILANANTIAFADCISKVLGCALRTIGLARSYNVVGTFLWERQRR